MWCSKSKTHKHSPRFFCNAFLVTSATLRKNKKVTKPKNREFAVSVILMMISRMMMPPLPAQDPELLDVVPQIQNP